MKFPKCLKVLKCTRKYIWPFVACICENSYSLEFIFSITYQVLYLENDWYVCYSSSFGQVFQNQKFNQSQLPLSGRYYLKNCAFFEMCKILLFLKNMLLWVPQLSLNEYILVGLQQSLRFYRMKSKHHKVSLLLTTYNISVFNTDKRKACSVYLKVNVLQFYWVHDEE